MVERFYENRKFMTWLASREPWDELVYRVALQDDIRDPAASIEWDERIRKLKKRLIHHEDEIVDLLVDVDQAKGEIAKIVDVK
jgi:hypothetical protein